MRADPVRPLLLVAPLLAVDPAALSSGSAVALAMRTSLRSSPRPLVASVLAVPGTVVAALIVATTVLTATARFRPKNRDPTNPGRALGRIPAARQARLRDSKGAGRGLYRYCRAPTGPRPHPGTPADLLTPSPDPVAAG